MGSRGIWTFMSARTRRSLTLTWTALFVLSLLLQYFSFAAAPPALAAHDIGIFELEGNADDEATAGADWENGAEGASDFFFAGASSEASANDNTYFTTGGSKDENDVSAWAITDTGAPDKDELTDAYAAVYQVGGDTWIYFGADRFDNDGTAQIGFWFFQDDIGISGGDFTGAHVDGDILIISEYTNGGVVSTICAYEWDSSGGGDNIANAAGCDPATNGSNLNLVAAGSQCDVADGTFDICAVTNEDAENAPWTFVNKDGETDFGPGQFFEGGINLSDLFGGDAPCFGTFLAETRTSAETDAQLKDFSLGDFDTCVPPDITTTSSVASADFGQQVTDTATLSGANGPVTGTVTFFICTPTQVTAAGCPEGSGSQVGAVKTISSGSATSDAYTVGTTAAAAGKYCWRAEYTPDASSEYKAGTHTNASTECFTVAAATIDIVKTANPAGPVSAGAEIGFDITVSNTGTTTTLGISVTDALPAGVDWTAAAPTGSTTGLTCAITGAVGSETLNCTKPSLAAGASFSIHFFGTTDSADCGTVSNTASVTTTNDGSDTATASVVVNCPDVTVAKTPDGGTVNAGGTIQFTIVVTNLGPGTATNVTLTDNLPAGIDWDEDSASCTITGAVGSEVLNCNFGTLAALATATVHVSGLTDANDCGAINNTATVDASNEPESANTNNSDSGSIEVLCAAIDIAKVANPAGPVIAGTTIGFDVTVTNSGSGTATDVHVSDPLPTGVDWTLGAISGVTTGVTCQITGAVGSEALTCDDPSMASGDSFMVHVSAATTADDCGTYNNTATVTTGNDGTDEASASVTVLCPDVAVDKNADVTPISAGETAAFTITVTSVGDDPAMDVVLDDTLPAGVNWTVTGVTLNGIAIANPCDAIAGGVLHCDLGDLDSGDVVIIHIGGQTDFADCGTLHNTVTVGAADEIPGGDANNTDAADIVVNCPELGIVKNADHDEAVVAGNEIGFTIIVANSGAGTAFNVAVSDTLDSGFSWSIESQDQDPDVPAINDFTLVGNVLSFSGNLPAGSEISVHVVADTDFEDCGLVPNQAFLTQGGEAVDDDTAAEEVRCPEIGIDKTSDDEDGLVDVGQTVTFTILATVEEGPVTDATITDVLPDGQTYVAGSQTSDPAETSFTVSPDGRTLTWAYDVLEDADSPVTITYAVTIDEGAFGGLENVVEFCVSEVPECESADETVTPNPELGIEKSNNAPIETIDLGDGTTIDLPTAEEGDTVTYTLEYTVQAEVNNAVITDVLPVGVTYVTGTASSDAQFTFVSYTSATRTLTWEADVVNLNGSLTYDATIDAGASELDQPLVNVATIDSDETEPDDDDSPVFVPPVPLELTPPPTDTLIDGATPSNPGFALMLILLAVAGLALTVGFITPVPEHVRRRDRLG